MPAPPLAGVPEDVALEDLGVAANRAARELAAVQVGRGQCQGKSAPTGLR